MLVVDQVIARVIQKEGGSKYTNIPGDAGGPTKFGVTLKTLSAWLNRNCTADDVKSMSLETAIAIYKQKYYSGPGIDALPICDELKENVFDFAVNAGPARAITLLQKLVGAKEDGVLGPASYNAARKTELAIGSVALNNAYVDSRLQFYKNLAKTKPQNKKFLKGWINRAESFRLRNSMQITAYTEQKISKVVAIAVQETETVTAVAPPKPLVKSRTLWSQCAIAVATVASAAAPLAQQASDAATTVQGAMEYLPSLKYLFVGLTLAATTFTVIAKLDDYRKAKKLAKTVQENSTDVASANVKE